MRTRVLPFRHVKSGLPLDVVLAGPGLEEDFQARAVPIDIEGVLVPVITAEDLIITKVLAGRAKTSKTFVASFMSAEPRSISTGSAPFFAFSNRLSARATC